MNPLELLTKTKIVREYGYPAALLDEDIAKGRLKSVKQRHGVLDASRYYIPRLAVERLIRERAGLELPEEVPS